MRDRWSLSAALAIIVALASRLLFLDWKAPHFDEGINGHFVDQIWMTGFFRYDPTNFHGPLYFYLLHLAELLLGRGVESFRFVTGLMSVGCVAVAAKHARYLGRPAIWAAWVLALSPAFMFYGRYAIHETLLIFSQLLFSYGFLRWRFEGGARAVAWMASGLAIAVTTKETFFIFFGTWAIAWGLLAISERTFPTYLRSAQSWPKALDVGGVRVWSIAALVTVVAVLALFSGFFLFPRGMSDMVAAFAVWTKTGTGATGHEKPFGYWFELLWQYEWPVLLALVIAPIACLFGSFWMRLYTLVGFGLWLAYSLIPYKTPWCVIGFVWPLALAFGYVMTESRARLARRSARFAFGLVAMIALGVSAATAVRLSFRDFEKSGEPYVYVQTTQDVPQVMGILEGRVKSEPEARVLRIQVLHRDPWPFPWLLGRFPRAEFAAWREGIVPAADVIFADAEDAPAIESKLTKTYYRRRLNIRDAYRAGHAYFAADGFAGWFSPATERVGPVAEGGEK